MHAMYRSSLAATNPWFETSATTMLPGMVAALTAVRDLGRLREIAVVLAKHGFGEIVGRMGLAGLAPKTTRPDAETNRRAAWPERVRLVLEDLGPSFMKLG